MAMPAVAIGILGGTLPTDDAASARGVIAPVKS